MSEASFQNQPGFGKSSWTQDKSGLWLSKATKVPFFTIFFGTLVPVFFREVSTLVTSVPQKTMGTFHRQFFISLGVPIGCELSRF
jgi:hypothetical protein